MSSNNIDKLQVIFLADDPAAAAKIPGLLSAFDGHSFPKSRRGPSTSSTKFYTNPYITVTDSGYTRLDQLQGVSRDNPSQGNTVGGDPSTIATILVEGRNHEADDLFEVGSPRHRQSGYSNRYASRRPTFGHPNREEGAFNKYSPAPFARNRPGSALARPTTNMTRVQREFCLQ